MNINLAAFFYLVAGVLFIQALRGLSSPESSRRGNYLGMIGMVIAVLTTLAYAAPASMRRRRVSGRGCWSSSASPSAAASAR